MGPVRGLIVRHERLVHKRNGIGLEQRDRDDENQTSANGAGELFHFSSTGALSSPVMDTTCLLNHRQDLSGDCCSQ